MARFAQDGWVVAALARRVELIDEFLEQNPALVGHVFPIKCDVTNRNSVQEAVAQFKSKIGHIDVAIANAGVSHTSTAVTMDTGIFEKTFSVNLFGALYLFESVIPEMVAARSGQLVGISSLAAYRGLPEAGAYCGSKAALSAVMESMRLDLASSKIRVTCIHPGFIKTPLTDKNRYWMPFLLSTDSGVNAIYNAILKNKTNYAFPFPLSALTKSLRFWPAGLYRLFISGRKNTKAEPQ